MLCQMQLQSLHPFTCNKFPIPAKPTTFNTSPATFSIPVKSSKTSLSTVGDTIPAPLISEQKTLNTLPFTQSLVAAAKNLGFPPTPEFGLLSHLFVLSMAFGAFFSVAAVSIPTIIAFGRLGASVKKLSKVVSEEVPGTLSSLKLSSMELNNLTQQLSSLRLKISGVGIGKKDGKTTSSRSSSKNQAS